MLGLGVEFEMKAAAGLLRGGSLGLRSGASKKQSGSRGREWTEGSQGG